MTFPVALFLGEFLILAPWIIFLIILWIRSKRG